MYVCMCMCVCVHLYVSMSVSVCMSVCVGMRMRLRCVCWCWSMCVHMQVCRYVYVCMHVCACLYAWKFITDVLYVLYGDVYVCMCVCMHGMDCMCNCMFMCVQCKCAYMRMRVCSVYVWEYVCVCMHGWMDVCMCVLYIWSYVRMYVCAHPCTYAYECMHMHVSMFAGMRVYVCGLLIPTHDCINPTCHILLFPDSDVVGFGFLPLWVGRSPHKINSAGRHVPE
jgi:hypothetical protein